MLSWQGSHLHQSSIEVLLQTDSRVAFLRHRHSAELDPTHGISRKAVVKLQEKKSNGCCHDALHQHLVIVDDTATVAKESSTPQLILILFDELKSPVMRRHAAKIKNASYKMLYRDLDHTAGWQP